MMARHDRGKPLEIKEYVGALAGRGRIVAAVAIVVGFLAVVLFILQPQRYKATATVVIPTPASTTTSAIAAVSQSYADFSGALSSQEVAEKTATAIGVPVSDVKGHLSSSRLAGSRLAEVTYTGTNRDQAPRIAQAASQAALEIVASADLAALDQQQQLAKKDLDDVTAELQQFIQDTGVADPGDPIIHAQKARIVALGNKVGAATAAGDDTGATAWQAKQDALQAKVAQELADLSRITTLRQTALESYSAAQAAFLTQQGLVNSMNTGSQVSVSDPTGAPRLAGLIKSVVPAVVVASGLAIAMIVLFEVVGPIRRQAAPDEGAGGDDKGVAGTAGADGDGEAKDAGADDQGQAEDEDDEDEEPERDPAGRRVRSRT
jgi:Chain length determinant protein